MKKFLETSKTAESLIAIDSCRGGGYNSLSGAGFQAQLPFKCLCLGRFRDFSFSKCLAFTLAELLITIGVLGILADMTIPTLVNNVNEKVRKEQARTAKYKLTQATDTMKSLDLIGPYPTTSAFVNELKKYFKIAKICENNNLAACWPTATIKTPDGNVNVSSLKTGTDIKALALGTGSTQTMGIVTGAGVPMILAYSPVCTQMDPYRTYTWSMVDFKPETNATTNCISAIFDINGSKGPNKLGTDVRTLNSIFGYKTYSATPMSYENCLANKDKLGIKECCPESYCKNNDYWAGAVDKCHDIGLHLPSMQTLANIAGAKYGRTDITPTTRIWANKNGYGDCAALKTAWWGYTQVLDANDICVQNESNNDIRDANSSVYSLAGNFWSSSEVSATVAQSRTIYSDGSGWGSHARYYGCAPLCVGD